MPDRGRWREKGFDAFIGGRFGNGGQNLYVSRAGRLQRIHHADVNRDGYLDLLFVNSQDMGERPPVYVVDDPLAAGTITELPTLGAYAAAVGDVNGDGYDDLVVCHQCNGTHSDLSAYLYYGGPGGFSERFKLELPVPDGRGVAIGDFNGDGRADLAFISGRALRFFYQRERGVFLPREHRDYDLDVSHVCAADLDGDGAADLYVRVRDQAPRIFWGGPDGIDPGRFTLVGGPDASLPGTPSSTPGWMAFAEGWRPKIITLSGRRHVFRSEPSKACFYPVLPDRTMGAPRVLDCEGAVAAAAGDVNGDGVEEIAVAACTVWQGKRHCDLRATRVVAESSWIYWGSPAGFSKASRTAFPTTNARDVELADLSGDGCRDVLVCQGGTETSNTTECLIYQGGKGGLSPKPIRFASHDACGFYAARSGPGSKLQAVLVNHVSGKKRGDVSAAIYLGGPDGYRPERRIELPGWSATDGLIADFNDDGFADVLLCNCAENAPWLDPGSFLYWNGAGGFRPDIKSVFPTIRAHGAATGDFRHSGYLDIAFAGFSNPELLIFRGGPRGFDLDNPQRILLDPRLKNFRPTRDVVEDLYAGESRPDARDYCEPRWLLAADFNNDGWLDLFVSQAFGAACLILWGGPDGFSLERSTRLYAEGGICARAADLSGNGYLDLVIGGHWCPSKKWPYDSYIYIYWNGPEGFREDRRAQLPAHGCNSLAIADFNNDGLLDIFATSYNSGRDRDTDSYIYWGMPGGRYSVENRSRLFGHSACGCVAADFNEDGFIDLAVADHKTYGAHAGFSKIWWNGPGGFCEQRVTRLPTLGPHGMVGAPAGNILDRGPEEYYGSSPRRFPKPVRLESIDWTADLPSKTWIRAQLRRAASRSELDRAPWQGPGGEGTWFDNHQALNWPVKAGDWLQYRLALGAVNGGSSPVVTGVSLSYARGGSD